MHFRKYKNQKDPQRMPTGSVIVTREDCSSIVSYNGAKEITLDLGFAVFGYTTKKPHHLDYGKKDEKESILYTTDSDGNPITASVFKFVDI